MTSGLQLTGPSLSNFFLFPRDTLLENKAGFNVFPPLNSHFSKTPSASVGMQRLNDPYAVS